MSTSRLRFIRAFILCGIIASALLYLFPEVFHPPLAY